MSQYMEEYQSFTKRDYNLIDGAVDLTVFRVQLEIALVQKHWESFKELLNSTEGWIESNQLPCIMTILLSFKMPIKYRVHGMKVKYP